MALAELDASVASTILKRELTPTEDAFIKEIEDAGGTVDLPPVEPEPTEAETIRRYHGSAHAQLQGITVG